MNSAFLESSYFGDFNCFIFHDVDMLPENKTLDYQEKLLFSMVIKENFPDPYRNLKHNIFI